MSQGTSQELTGRDFAEAWNMHHEDLLEWLRRERFSAQQSEIDAAFSAASAEVCKDDWQTCRNLFQQKKGTKKTALEYLQAVFRRAVRTVEIKLWSRRILGQDYIPSGPLPLPDTWRRRLPAPWNSSNSNFATILQAEFGELAFGGWQGLGAYGVHSDPGDYFLKQLQHRLKWHKTHGTWEAALYQATDAEGRSLLKVFEQQALTEFNDPADGERAFQWAIDYLVKKKFTSSNIPSVHEVSNPSGFLRTAFAHALVDFRRAAWRPDQVQRPRQDVWMRRLLDRDWIDVFHFSIKHASTETVINSFLSGEQLNAADDDLTDAEDPASPGLDAKQGMPRMTEAQRRFHERAQQIEADHRDDPAARIRAIAVWCRSYLEQVKQWFPVASDLPLFITDSEGEESERPLPHVECDPLATLLCEEDRRRLLGTGEQVDQASNEGDNLEGRLRAFIRTILGPGFALSTEEIAILRRIADPPAPKKGKPPKDTAKQQLLSRLRQAAKAAGLDTSIFDSVSVIFPSWNEGKPQDHPDPQSGRRPPGSGAGSGDTP